MKSLSNIWKYLLFLSFIQNVNGLKLVKSQMLLEDDHLVNLGSNFGFDVGGRLEVVIKASTSPGFIHDFPNLPVFIVVMNSDQVRELKSQERDKPDAIKKICEFPYLMRSQLSRNNTIKWISNQEGFYTVGILNCAERTVYVHGSLLFQNTNGEHLSLDDVYLVPLYSIVSLMYCLLCSVWIYILYKSKNFSHLTRIIFLVVLLLKLLKSVSLLSMYRQISSTGEPSHFSDLIRVLEITQNISFLSLCLVISIGWAISRPQTRSQKTCFFASTFMLISIENISSFCNPSQSAVSFCGVFQAVGGLLEFLLSAVIIVALQTNIERLRFDSLEPSSNLNLVQNVSHISLFRKFRIGFFSFICVPVFELSLQNDQSHLKERWISKFFFETSQIAIIMIVFSCLQPPPSDQQHTSFEMFEDNQNFLTEEADPRISESRVGWT